MPRSRRIAVVSAMLIVASVAAFQTILVVQNVNARRDASHIIALTGAQRARIQEIGYLALGLGIGSPEPHANRRIQGLIADMIIARRQVKHEPSFIVGSNMNKGVMFSALIDGFLANVQKLERYPGNRQTLAKLRGERLAVIGQFDDAITDRVAIADDESWNLERGLFVGLILQIASIVGTWFLLVEPTDRRANALLAELKILANSDSLTRLANRTRFAKELARTVGRDTPFALHYIDLDNFKTVNDLYGHPTGDLVLQIVADRLRACTRSIDIVARLGGDEFAVLQGGPIDREHAALFAQRIVDALSIPATIDGVAHKIGGSIGIALYPEHGIDPATLANAADRGLYLSKNRGGGRYAMFGVAGLNTNVFALRSKP